MTNPCWEFMWPLIDWYWLFANLVLFCSLPADRKWLFIMWYLCTHLLLTLPDNLRPSDNVQKILGNYAEFPGGYIMRQKKPIMQQIMRFLWIRFHIEHVLSWDSQQHWRFQRLCVMFPVLNSSYWLAFYVCYFVQLMHFLSIIRFLMDYAIACHSRSIVQNRTSA